MKKALALALTLAATALTGPTLAGAGDSAASENTVLTASMSPRQVVTVKNTRWKVPASVAKAKGSFSARLDEATGKLTWRIRYSGVGNPALPTVDIHSGRAGKFGPVLVRLCARCKSGQRGTVKVKALAERDIVAGRSWVTLITEKYPNGVLRGQIKVG